LNYRGVGPWRAGVHLSYQGVII